jgi:hypothetical protein
MILINSLIKGRGSQKGEVVYKHDLFELEEFTRNCLDYMEFLEKRFILE